MSVCLSARSASVSSTSRTSTAESNCTRTRSIGMVLRFVRMYRPREAYPPDSGLRSTATSMSVYARLRHRFVLAVLLFVVNAPLLNICSVGIDRMEMPVNIAASRAGTEQGEESERCNRGRDRMSKTAQSRCKRRCEAAHPEQIRREAEQH